MLASLKSALLATGLTLMMATAPHAAVVSFDLDASFLNGPFVGSALDPFSLTITYDDDDLTYGTANDGDGYLSPEESLTIVFDGVNIEDLDVEYPEFPKVGFVDYIPVSIDFVIDFGTLPQLLDLGILVMSIGGDLDANEPFDVVYDQATDRYSTFATVIEVAAIPLPAGLPLLAGGLGLMALAARRRTRS